MAEEVAISSMDPALVHQCIGLLLKKLVDHDAAARAAGAKLDSAGKGSEALVAEGFPRPDLLLDQAASPQQAAAPASVQAAAPAIVQAAAPAGARPAQESPREVPGASQAPPVRGSEATARSLPSIEEEPESEDSVDLRARKTPARGTAGSAGVKRKEAPRKPGSGSPKKQAGVPVGGSASAKTAPRRPVAGPKKEAYQGRGAKADRTASSEDLSDAFYEAETRYRYLLSDRDKRRAAKAREDAKFRAKAKAKTRVERSRSKDEESESYYSDESNSSSESPEAARKRSRRSPRGRSRSATASPRSEEDDYGARKQAERRPRSRSDRRKKEDDHAARKKEVPAPWKEEGAGHQKGGKKGRGKGAPKPVRPGDFHEAYADHGYFNLAGSSASFQDNRSGTRTEADRQPPSAALEWLAEQERKREFHQFEKTWHLPKDWPARYFEQGWPYCPPRVEGKDRDLFQDTEGMVFNFHKLGFTYIGPDDKYSVKQHWQPHPYTPREPQGKGCHKGAHKGHPGRSYTARFPPGKGHQKAREPEATEACGSKKGEGEERPAKGWFPEDHPGPRGRSP
jgi:hypothetical protein